MKKKFKKMFAGLFAVTLTCTYFVGCSKNSGKYSGETITVQVSEINGSEVTAQVGTMEEISMDKTPPSGMPQGGDNTFPGGMPDNVFGGAASPDGIPNDISGGAAFPDGMPNDISGGAMQPDRNGRKPSFFTADEDSVSFTLSDNIIINVASMNGQTEGSIENIAEGSVLEVTYDDNGQVTSILVQNSRGGKGGPGGNNKTGNTKSTT